MLSNTVSEKKESVIQVDIFGRKQKFVFHRNSRKLISKFRDIMQTQVNFSSSLSFYQYFEVFFMNFKICFRHLVLLEMISFARIFETVAQNFAI